MMKLTKAQRKIVSTLKSGKAVIGRVNTLIFDVEANTYMSASGVLNTKIVSTMIKAGILKYAGGERGLSYYELA